MEEKAESDILNTSYQVDYRNVKYPRLEFKTGTLLLVLPKNYKEKEKLIQKHKKWIQTKSLIIKTALEEAKNKKLNLNRTDRELKQLVHKIVKRFTQKYNFKVNKIYFRKMKTKWGSYSKKGNLTINTLLKYLPKHLIEYVIFHEMTHSIVKKHNKQFWNQIQKEFKGYESKEKDLLVYWFLIQKIFHSF